MLFEFLKEKIESEEEFHLLGAIGQDNTIIDYLAEFAFSVIKTRDNSAISMAGYHYIALKDFFTFARDIYDYDNGYVVDDNVYDFSLCLTRMFGKKSISFKNETIVIDDELAKVIKQAFGTLEDPYKKASRLITYNETHGSDFRALHDIHIDPAKGEISSLDYIMPYIMGFQIKSDESYGYLSYDKFPKAFRFNPIAIALNTLHNDNSELNDSTSFMAQDISLQGDVSNENFLAGIYATNESYLSAIYESLPSEMEKRYRVLASEIEKGKPLLHYLDESSHRLLDEIKKSKNFEELAASTQIFINNRRCSSQSELPVNACDEEKLAQNAFKNIASLALTNNEIVNRLLTLSENDDGQSLEHVMNILDALRNEQANFAILDCPTLFNDNRLNEMLLRYLERAEHSIEKDAAIYMLNIDGLRLAVNSNAINENNAKVWLRSYSMTTELKFHPFPAVISEKLGKLIAACEKKIPGFLKDFSLNTDNEQINDYAYQHALKLINQEKTLLSQDSQCNNGMSDMSFMNSVKL